MSRTLISVKTNLLWPTPNKLDKMQAESEKRLEKIEIKNPRKQQSNAFALEIEFEILIEFKM